ncbi:MAG TPA: hypothetical protein PK331_13990 [Gordonia sp. (in: high G+C Gram-positive bacteria)]|uniref:FAD-dependent oxidoreductase n=1 Tax=unclassified Gordonia (in: high G+C Gram-positive bacteria) TaxID=2657482 RepID=UPI0025BF1183|nr:MULTISPECIES: hypothetical protein [unclassified Gordonia (in: high G+C Gram-positive bacteria)]HNP58438.1 hypothetical protein [Gordonia sp. (in: high G+C Gram-positive bacteria)]HRC52016.1 hypothetical protein [Gordonia sp. (in: high G+C Gram-positive bacteria)]
MSLGKRAVILGGSIAGMCAAGAVAPYFDEVLVLERDIIPADAEHRRGIPQSKHPHFLLNSGRRAMDDLFPGFEDALLDAGGLHMMASLAAAHCEGDYWVPRKEAPMTMVYASRLLIERTLRDRLATVPNIRVEEGINIEGLETVDGGQPGGRVTGVWVTGGDGGRERRLVEGDFIIDTLGRGSNVSDWLVNAGWPEVRVQSLDAGVTYVSRWYQKPADLPAEWWWAQMSVMPTADTNPHPIEHDFLCQIFPIEGERVLVTMGSWGHPMPRKEEEFLETVSKVRAPAFARAVAMCEPISKVFVTKSTGNRRRRYDELANPPAGLVVIGDAVCGFNPFYAQGMSSAAKSSVLLREKLAAASSVDEAFVKDYFGAQRKLLDEIWTLALARDQGYANAEGTDIAPAWRQKLAYKAAWPVFNFISATTREDAVVGQHFADVFNLDESVTTMIKSPRVLAGFAWFGLKKMFGRTKLPMGTDNQLDPPSDIWRDWKPTPGGRALVIPKGTPVQDIPSVSSAEPIAAVSASASNQAKAG